VAGTAILGVALFLWRHRARLADRDAPDFDPQGRSSWILGATITAIELPTAFPYFAAIAAVVGADVDAPKEILLLVVFNLCFVLPLIGILATLTFAGDRAQRLLCRGRDFLQAHWPRVLAVVGVAAGLFVIALGVTGLASSMHSDFGQLVRRIRHHLIHPLK
jgi:cytochrome c biogenesis protein CcdA